MTVSVTGDSTTVKEYQEGNILKLGKATKTHEGGNESASVPEDARTGVRLRWHVGTQKKTPRSKAQVTVTTSLLLCPKMPGQVSVCQHFQ